MTHDPARCTRAVRHLIGLLDGHPPVKQGQHIRITQLGYYPDEPLRVGEVWVAEFDSDGDHVWMYGTSACLCADLNDRWEIVTVAQEAVA